MSTWSIPGEEFDPGVLNSQLPPKKKGKNGQRSVLGMRSPDVESSLEMVEVAPQADVQAEQRSAGEAGSSAV